MVDSTNLPEVDINAIATDLNNKMDRDGVNATASVCIESWHDENGNWYRVYSDGWCEQGGIDSNSSYGSWKTITLLKNYINTNFIINANCYQTGNDTGSESCVKPLSSNSFQWAFTTRLSNSGPYYCMWRTEGYIR